jgi:hypothetical protein
VGVSVFAFALTLYLLRRAIARGLAPKPQPTAAWHDAPRRKPWTSVEDYTSRLP